MILTERQKKELVFRSIKLIRFLNKNCHPHTKIIIDSTSIELMEVAFGTGEIGIKNFVTDIPIGACGFCREKESLITKDPDGLMCDTCWDKD